MLSRYVGFGNWKDVHLFENMPKDTWERRVLSAPAVWRVMPLSTTPTEFGWGVAELELYKDLTCTERVTEPQTYGSGGHFGNNV